jgi:hypothetical protein
MITVCFNNMAHGGHTYLIAISDGSSKIGNLSSDNRSYLLDIADTLSISYDMQGNPLEPNKYYEIYYSTNFRDSLPSLLYEGTLTNNIPCWDLT